MQTILHGLIALTGLYLVAVMVFATRLVLKFRRDMLTRLTPPMIADSELPAAAVVLALRGPDPHLPQTLHALLNQDYPEYRIQIVVDSEHDPVLDDVRQVQYAPGGERIRVAILRDPAGTCSLKCSSLIQAVRDLESRFQIVAFIDGDVLPHRTWLKELATPLVRGEADACGGNRWYLPPTASWGGMTRYFWNGAFMLMMWARQVPWAGTMALRRQTIDEIGLLTAWKSAMSVDATLHRLLEARRRRFLLIPSLMMSNREDIALGPFFTWVTRQMAVARYSGNETRRASQLVGLLLLVIHVTAPLLAVVAAVAGYATEAWVAASILPVYWLSGGLRSLIVEATFRRILHARGEAPGWLTPAKALIWYPALVLTHLRMFDAFFRALQTRQVHWRGINYRLMHPGQVRMEGYRPYSRSTRNSKRRDHSVL